MVIVMVAKKTDSKRVGSNYNLNILLLAQNNTKWLKLFVFLGVISNELGYPSYSNAKCKVLS